MLCVAGDGDGAVGVRAEHHRPLGAQCGDGVWGRMAVGVVGTGGDDGQAGAQAVQSLRAEGFDGPITLVGDEVVGLYSAFWIPGMNSRPLSDKDPDICPALVPLRRRLMAMVGRPVNIQGTRDWVMFVREHLMGQPFLTLVGRVESA